LLASAALDQENARMERAEWSESLQRIVEESSEYFVFVDEEGRVCESSRAARTFLHLGSGHTEEVRLENLFVPASREAVVNWHEQVIRRASSGAVDFVARTDRFLPFAARMLDRRVRLAERVSGMIHFPSSESAGDFGEILRHEVNNPRVQRS
jgi:hypothetical protein